MTPAEAVEATVGWREATATVDGRDWPYRECGVGETLLLLDPPGLDSAEDGPIESLANGYRLIAMQSPDGGVDAASEGPPARTAARLLGRLMATLGIEHVTVIARGEATSVALWLAIDAPGTVTTLVLESPPTLGVDPRDPGPDAELAVAMAALEVPTLVLVGERTDPVTVEQLTAYKRLPASTFGLVYDAGDDLRGDRPSAYLSAVGEYLKRGQAFVVSTNSTVIHA